LRFARGVYSTHPYSGSVGATTGGLKVRVTFEVVPDGRLLPQRAEETKALLRELGLDDGVERMM